MKISQVASLSNLSVHTLRYYEKLGLIMPKTRAGNNYRYYSDDDLITARFIKRCKDSGFSLADTARLISIKDAKEAHTCAEAKSIALGKIEDIKQQIQQLVELKQVLTVLSENCCGTNESAEFCTIIAQLETTTGTTSPDSASLK